jgi:pyruvate-formate lyase-activating enzyme
LIPGITDTEVNLKAIGELAEEHRVELMPYNELAGAKYPMVGMEYPLEAIKNRQEDFTRYFQNAVMLK